MDWIVVGGGAYRHYGKDLDVRLEVHDGSTEFETSDSLVVLPKAHRLVNIPKLSRAIWDIVGKEVPLDIGLTIKVKGFKLSVLWHNELHPQELLPFRWFKWCYYLNRGN